MSTESRAKLSFLPEDATTYYELWLRGDGRSHDPSAIAAFARAHRSMSGRQIDVFERGYRGWLDQRGIADSPEAFAEFVAPRYARWRASLLRNDVIETLATVRRGHRAAA